MVAGFCSWQTALAQTGSAPGATSGSSGSSGTGSSTSGAGASPFGGSSGSSSGFGSGSTGSGFGTTPAAGASSSFGTPAPIVPEPTAGATGGGASTSGSQSSLQGTGFGTTKVPDAAPPSFTLPGFYGASSTSLTAGEGRLARPRFRYTVSVSSGYDDNTLQTPTKSEGTPAIFQDVLVDPGTPATLQEVPVFSTIITIGQGGLIIPVTVQTGTRLQVIPGTDPKFRRVLVQEATPKQERSGSAVTRGSAGFDLQLFSSRALFTFDLNVGADHYWTRPTRKQTDYNGAVVFSFLYRVTPRLQFTAQLNAAYLTQPDLSRINTPQDQSGGAYINSNAKLDLSYRWSPRFSTVTSLSDNALLYQDKLQQAGDYNEIVVGNEFRYLTSPRLTLLAEARYSSTTYDQDQTRDSTAIFLLLGAEAQFSRRFSGSLRLGESLQTFTEMNETSTTPYLEGSVGFRLGPTSVVNLNTRFGFEAPSTAGTESLVYRIGLSYSQAFSPRLSGGASANYLHNTTSTIGADTTEDVTNTYDLNLQLNYLVTRDFSLNANYSFTTLISEQGFRDYYRSRFFLGGSYTF